MPQISEHESSRELTAVDYALLPVSAAFMMIAKGLVAADNLAPGPSIIDKLIPQTDEVPAPTGRFVRETPDPSREGLEAVLSHDVEMPERHLSAVGNETDQPRAGIIIKNSENEVAQALRKAILVGHD